MLDLTLSATELGPLLVGALVVDHGVTIQLTEVEAYAGADDPAAHAYPGPRPRTRDLFGPPGTLYCYLSHGLHVCGNVVCGTPGEGAAVLLRAGRVVEGLEVARERRPGVADVALARGPGNLGRTLGWTLADSGRIFDADGPGLVAGPPPAQVCAGPRVGVSVAYSREWRYWARADPTVSAYRRSPRIVPGRHDW